MKEVSKTNKSYKNFGSHHVVRNLFAFDVKIQLVLKNCKMKKYVRRRGLDDFYLWYYFYLRRSIWLNDPEKTYFYGRSLYRSINICKWETPKPASEPIKLISSLEYNILSFEIKKTYSNFRRTEQKIVFRQLERKKFRAKKFCSPAENPFILIGGINHKRMKSFLQSRKGGLPKKIRVPFFFQLFVELFPHKSHMECIKAPM